MAPHVEILGITGRHEVPDTKHKPRDYSLEFSNATDVLITYQGRAIEVGDELGEPCNNEDSSSFKGLPTFSYHKS